MKKILVLFLSVALCLICLASCEVSYKKNAWYTEDVLSDCLVPELPTIKKDFINESDKDIYVSLNENEFDDYVKAVFEYLKSQDFNYLGTRGGQKSTLAGAFTTYFFEPADYLSRFEHGSSYIFVFSDDSADENGEVIFSILTIRSSEETVLEYENDTLTYNTVISLRKGSEAPLGGRYVLPSDKDHRHVYGEWQFDSEYHWCSVDCTWDMCDIDTVSEHYDKDGDKICDACKFSMAKIPLPDIENWLSEISSDSVVSIRSTHSGYNVLDGELKKIITVTDKALIDEIIDSYRAIKLDPLPINVNYEITDEYFRIEFTLSSGETKTIAVSGGFMYSKYFLVDVPKLDGYENVSISYSLHVYKSYAPAYRSDGKSLCTVRDVKNYEFVKADSPSAETAEFYITTDVGKMEIYTETKFMLNGEWYELKNADFYATVIPCLELVRAHEEKYVDGRIAYVKDFCGVYGSGAIVGMLTDDKTGYDGLMWNETVLDYCFEYSDSNRLLVLYEGEFYTLSEAYENGYLTKDDIAKVWDLTGSQAKHNNN